MFIATCSSTKYVYSIALDNTHHRSFRCRVLMEGSSRLRLTTWPAGGRGVGGRVGADEKHRLCLCPVSFTPAWRGPSWCEETEAHHLRGARLRAGGLLEIFLIFLFFVKEYSSIKVLLVPCRKHEWHSCVWRKSAAIPAYGQASFGVLSALWEGATEKVF